MTEAELAEIEARAMAATEGSWSTGSSNRNGVEWGAVYEDRREGDLVALINSGPADRDFIAHARTDVPALVAEVRRLRTEGARIAASWVPPEIAQNAAKDAAASALEAAARSFEAIDQYDTAKLLRDMSTAALAK